MDPAARFDDLVSGRSFEFEGLQRTVTADHVDDIRPAIAAVESAVAEGAWAAGYLAYEAAPGFDPGLSVRRREPHDIPLLWFGIYADRAPASPLAARTIRPAPYAVSAWLPSVDRASYDATFAEIRDHIAAGDTYQVNHTFRLRSAFAGEEFELYRDLALSQRGSYSAFLDLGRYVIASASPELFFRLDRGVLTTRPMKGTIGRGRWSAEDDVHARPGLSPRKRTRPRT